MKIRLEMKLPNKDFEEYFKGERAEEYKDEMKEELKQRLFEVCEDWVLKGQEPDLEFK